MNDPKQKSIEKIEAAIEAVRSLVDARAAAKLSVGRISGVARELAELLKVVATVECDAARALHGGHITQ